GLKHWPPNKAVKEAFKNEAYILELGICAISILEWMCGPGTNQGEKFKTASVEFELAGRMLEDATPDPRDWSGSSADEYSAQNDAQIARAEKMMKCDKAIAGILKDEVASLKTIKNKLAEFKLGLTGAIPPALLLFISDPTGKESLLFQSVVFMHIMPFV